MIRRILYLGQKAIGERCFELLLSACDEKLHLAAVVSNTGKDVWWSTNRIYEKAMKSGLPFLSNEERNDDKIQHMIVKEKVNTILSVQHPWVIPAKTLSLVDNHAFNLHNAKLSRYRGYNACSHAILNRDTTYSCTMHWMTATVDSGDIAYEESFAIDNDETALSLYNKACKHAELVFRKLMDAFQHDRNVPHEKASGKGKYYSKTSLEKLREIRNISDHDEVDRKSRAFYFPPFEPSFFTLHGMKFFVYPESFFKKR